MFKIIKKYKKWVSIARAHVDATWHARPRGSATWTRAMACVAGEGDTWTHIAFISYSLIFYIAYGSPSLRGQCINISYWLYLIY